MAQELKEVVTKIEEVPRWPAAIALLVIGIVYLLLPAELVFGPPWLMLALASGLLGLFWLLRRLGQHSFARTISLTTVGIVTCGLLFSALFLVQQLQNHQIPANSLLRDAFLI